ncbi:hypothetical protein EST38_g5221 [Candolleomyces aberdarensis]|uniref:Uncharacterized protein n=1 Tax=Candolleomyces aberdarensis TaxID=2316362 RepID=A0A4Q2DKX1_9AGAR|nr:hypothetical protein EST38_g5221 [Candolleomyces aberdarensis]
MTHAYVIASSIVVPTILWVFNQAWSLPPFVPRQVVDENDLFPLLFAPWAGPQSLFAILSRILQVIALFRLPPLPISIYFQYTYALWIYIALARTLAGWVLSRCVGWALPRLFRHWALYEPSSGFGPMLFVLSVWQTTDTLVIIRTTQGVLPGPPTRRYGYLPHALVFGMLLCWLENAPWTYGIALLACFAIVLALLILSFVFPRLGAASNQTERIFDDGGDAEMAIIGEPLSQPSPSTKLSLRRTITLGLLSLVIMEAPYNIFPIFTPITLTPMPPPPSPPSPLLEILVLTYPRSDLEANLKIMQTTIQSYLPLLGNDTHLSIFTHATEHRAFERLQQTFSDSTITFFADNDTHPDAYEGHYLHLAEAFRWVSGPRPNLPQAEWVMLIEDDFPLCAGHVGRDALRRVLTILEASRPSPDSPVPRRRGGFIGTGGSGLIIHNTLLPILQLVLHAHAEKQSKLPLGGNRRPPDLVLQDCLLGKDPLCALTRGDVCPDQNSKPSNCGLVITSRLVMDHIGGMYTTTVGKATNSDKWRCGWRHPFHGSKGVEVVVTDW